jgi:hypothetical protein
VAECVYDVLKTKCFNDDEGHSLGCIVILLGAHFAELISYVILERRVVPFSLRLEEQCKGVTSGESH